MVGDLPYFIPAVPYTTTPARGLGELQSINVLSPVTVVTVAASNATIESLGSIIREFAKDDVWNTAFLKDMDTSQGANLTFLNFIRSSG
ncbi:MAG: hypothetical protein Q9200_002859 [Gallowayella weberi]